MKITHKRLKQIIKEEMQNLSEMPQMATSYQGETDRFAGGYHERKQQELVELMREMYGADPMNFEGNVERAKKMAMNRNAMQESKKK